MVPPAPLPAMSLRPSDMPEDAPERRSRLQSVTARIYMKQWCDLKDIEAVDPEHRTLSDIVRDALAEYLPREKVRLKAAHAAQGEQLHVLTRVHRTLAQRQTGKEMYSGSGKSARA